MIDRVGIVTVCIINYYWPLRNERAIYVVVWSWNVDGWVKQSYRQGFLVQLVTWNCSCYHHWVYVFLFIQRVIFNVVNFSKTKSLYREGMTPLVKSTSRPSWYELWDWSCTGIVSAGFEMLNIHAKSITFFFKVSFIMQILEV